MNKETVLEKLKNKYSSLGLSNSILGSQSDFILNQNPTNENIDSLIINCEPLLKAFQSDIDKIRTKAQTTKNTTEKEAKEALIAPEWYSNIVQRLDKLDNQKST